MRALALITLLSAAPAAALAQASEQFDLMCHGTIRSETGTERAIVDFSARVIVDLPGKKFCIKDCKYYIYPITHLDSRVIEYDYDVQRAGPDHNANQLRWGGGLDYQPERDRIVIMRSSHRFHEDFTYVMGDIVSWTTREWTHATCEPAPFSGIAGEPTRSPFQRSGK